jgi:hypothetical protein
MASIGTLAFVAAAASAAVAFAVVSIIGSEASPADLGGPVVVEPGPAATTSPLGPEATTSAPTRSPPGIIVLPPGPESPDSRDDDSDDGGDGGGGDDDDADDGGDD